jgi:hypothetical protein
MSKRLREIVVMEDYKKGLIDVVGDALGFNKKAEPWGKGPPPPPPPLPKAPRGGNFQRDAMAINNLRKIGKIGKQKIPPPPPAYDQRDAQLAQMAANLDKIEKKVNKKPSIWDDITFGVGVGMRF